MEKKKCWKLSKNICIVLTGSAALINAGVAVYIYYNVDLKGMVNRINHALDTYAAFLPEAEQSIEDFNEIIQAMNSSIFQLRTAVNRLLVPAGL